MPICRPSFAKSFLIGTLLLAASDTLGGMPKWAAENTQRVEGTSYDVVCSGTGPSLDLARQDARESCRVSATQQLATSLSVKSLSVETEKAVGYHREVSEDARYTGLVCVPVREHIENLGDQIQVWLECRFDLSKAKALPPGNPEESKKSDKKRGGWVKNRHELEAASLHVVGGKRGRHESSNQKMLTLAIVPPCKDLIIKGSGPARIIQCKGRNPISVPLAPMDLEIIVRADDHLPKTVKLMEHEGGEEDVQIFLDRQD